MPEAVRPANIYKYEKQAHNHCGNGKKLADHATRIHTAVISHPSKKNQIARKIKGSSRTRRSDAIISPSCKIKKAGFPFLILYPYPELIVDKFLKYIPKIFAVVGFVGVVKPVKTVLSDCFELVFYFSRAC